MFVNLKQEKALTLIEMIISVLILGLALGAMLGTFVMGRISATKAKHHIEAMNHARAAMEQYIDDGTTYTLPDGDIKTLDGDCSVVPTTYATDIKKVVVTISWTDRSMGGSRTVSEELVTLVSE